MTTILKELLIAAEDGNAEVVRAIVKNNPEILRNVDYGDLPAFVATDKGHALCLEIIACAAPESLGIPYEDGKTLALMAADQGHADCLKIIVRAAPDSLGIPGEAGATPAILAVRSGHAECLKVIALAAPESLRTPMVSGATPAHVAAFIGCAECLEIIAHTAPESLGISDADNATPAIIAAHKGHTDCLNIIAHAAPDTLKIPILNGATNANKALLSGHAGCLEIAPETFIGHSESTKKGNYSAVSFSADPQGFLWEKVFMSWTPAPWQDATKTVGKATVRMVGNYDKLQSKWHQSPMQLDITYEKEDHPICTIAYDTCMVIQNNRAKKVIYHHTTSIKDKSITLFYYEKDWYYTHKDISAEDAALLIVRTIRIKKEKLERIIERERNLAEGQGTKRRREGIPVKVQQFVWRRDQGVCVQCGSNENLEYDHIIPFSKGGSNTARNLQLLCEKCNRQKGNRIS